MLGGIYSGLFTPTEAAAVAAVYAFIVAVFVYKGLKFAEVPAVLLKAASMSAMILYIITNAAVFSWLLTSEQIPQSMAGWMSAQGFGTVGFLLVTNIVLLAAGNFMDPAAIVLIMAPILFPMARGARRQPGASRRADGGQYGGRAVPSAGRAQPLCRLRHHRHGHRRTHRRGLAVARHHADLPGDGDLHPGAVALAAASVGDAVIATPSSANVVAELWRLAGGDAAALDYLHLSGDDPVLPSSFRIGTAAQASIAAVGLAAAELHHRAGASAPDQSVSTCAMRRWSFAASNT